MTDSSFLLVRGNTAAGGTAGGGYSNSPGGTASGGGLYINGIALKLTNATIEANAVLGGWGACRPG